MQAEEIARRMGGPLVTDHPAGYLKAIADQLDNISLVVGNDMVFVGNALRALADFLPTGEERLAIKALRAGCYSRPAADGGKWFSRVPGGAVPELFDTPIAALAAAGRVLEEGEKR